MYSVSTNPATFNYTFSVQQELVVVSGALQGETLTADRTFSIKFDLDFESNNNKTFLAVVLNRILQDNEFVVMKDIVASEGMILF